MTSPYFTPILFGLGAINLAKNPDGVLALVGHAAAREKRLRARAVRAASAAAESTRSRPRSDGAGIPTRHAADGRAVGCSTAPALALEAIVAGYGDVEVLHGVDGRGAAGAGRRAARRERRREVDAVRGRRGHASTPTSGRVLLDGADVTDASRAPSGARGLCCSCPKRVGSSRGSASRRTCSVLLVDDRDRAKAYERFPILGERRGADRRAALGWRAADAEPGARARASRRRCSSPTSRRSGSRRSPRRRSSTRSASSASAAAPSCSWRRRRAR